MQLASLGPQDIYLTGNPEITLFKKAYMRYTNFSSETVQVSFDGSSIDFGSVATATLEKSGDLISRMVLVLNLSKINSITPWGYVDKLGHAIIDSITIRIGQSDVDVHTFDWIDIYHNLYKNKSHESRYNTMIGNTPELKNISNQHDSYNLYIPFDFWFCKSTSLSFPICALQNQRFQVTIKLRNNIDVINYLGTTEPISSDLPIIESGYLLVDYIYLENEERNLFKSNNHEYLIEQLQDMTDVMSANNSTIGLIFDKPCKYLIWNVNLDRYFTRNPFLVWASDGNWTKAIELFGKLVWLATRADLTYISLINFWCISFGVNQYVNIGQEAPMVTSTTCFFSKLLSLASKVNAIMLFANKDETGNVIANAIPDNIILTTNNITIQDISYTLNEILVNTNNTVTPFMTKQQDFLNQYVVNIINVLNTGNFIDGSDNPIVLSSFQLNGKNRFQQKDGFYFNYLQPYYYFTNSPPDGVNIYSFSLEPEDVQPSGTINLGYINSKNLIIQLGIHNTIDPTYFNTFFQSGRIRIYTLSYTVLKLAQGQVVISY